MGWLYKKGKITAGKQGKLAGDMHDIYDPGNGNEFCPDHDDSGETV